MASSFQIPSTFSVPTPSQTASVASSFVPPFAGSTASAISANGPTSTSSVSNPNPSTPALLDDHEWITAYLTIHQLSAPSYRYMYILWLAVVLVFLIFAVLHWTGRRGGVLGGLWNKWSLRRRTWRKQHSLAEAKRKNRPHKQPTSLPSNAQLLSLVVLCVAALLLSFLGPDYIAPGTHVWDLTHNDAARGLAARAAATRPTPIPMTALNSQPQYTIPKAWWTAGGRTGTIAFALFPLCVLFALKAPPFAVFALPFLIQIYNDKLAFLHRWTGRLIWFITFLHVALWGVQLSRDKRGKDNPASVWSFAFEYDKFVYGWLGFICLTLLITLSFRPVRTEFYEAFYFLHVLLVPLTLIFSALHFPPTGWWCWSALIVWGAERAWRIVRYLQVNGLVSGLRGRRNTRYANHIRDKPSGRMNAALLQNHAREPSSMTQYSEFKYVHRETEAGGAAEDRISRIPQSRPLSLGQETIKSIQTGSSVGLVDNAEPIRYGYTPSPTPVHPYHLSQHKMAGYSARGAYVPPPGYAHATLLPGHTIRLRLIPPRHFTWAPGQHVLLTIPSVAKFSSHPFTIASICDSEAQSDDGREIVILIRARTGFTKNLWLHIEQLENAGSVGDEPSFEFTRPSRGVLLRALIDGPFGSSVRARWTAYSTILIIAGGSGVSFAAAVLEYTSMCMTGRNGNRLGGRAGGWGHGTISQISRIRFVWIVREFSHIQWAASIIRRCMDMVPPSALQIDIFVTNVAPPQPRPPLSVDIHSDTLVPPSPYFTRSGTQHHNVSESSLGSATSTSPVDAAHADIEYQVSDILDMYGDLGHEEHVLDLTNFDGEDDTHLPGERMLSRRLRKEGKLRRARTRMSVGNSPASPVTRHHTAGHVPRAQPFNSIHETVDPLSPNSAGALHRPLTPGRLRVSLISDQTSPISPNDSLFSPPTQTRNVLLSPNPGDIQRSPSPALSVNSDLESGTTHAFSGSDPRRFTKFDMDEVEADDMPVVSERARPGRAKIDVIMANEAQACRGSMIVACCGPTSLNVVVRKSIATQIHPSRILTGAAPTIALVSEDFEW
ncbi:hypothetical protein BU17DRAFT_45155 [Hysterangium stoloniferum]|nr:hypothetical protein BU17DRAFT_45155 [Hysterangium stoloniferum]